MPHRHPESVVLTFSHPSLGHSSLRDPSVGQAWVPTRVRVIETLRNGSAVSGPGRPSLTPLPSLAPQHWTRPWQEWWGGLQVCTPAVFLPEMALASEPRLRGQRRASGSQTPELGWEGSSSSSVYSYLNIPQNDMHSSFRVHNMKGSWSQPRLVPCPRCLCTVGRTVGP